MCYPISVLGWPVLSRRTCLAMLCSCKMHCSKANQGNGIRCINPGSVERGKGCWEAQSPTRNIRSLITLLEFAKSDCLQHFFIFFFNFTDRKQLWGCKVVRRRRHNQPGAAKMPKLQHGPDAGQNPSPCFAYTLPLHNGNATATASPAISACF